MASISNSIEIQDRFSSALNRLNTGLQTAINRFIQLNTLMHSNPNLNVINNGVDRFDSGLRNVASTVNNVNNTLNNTNNILNHMGNNVVNVNTRFGDTNNTIINVINNQERLNENINRGNTNANGLLGTFKKIAATYLGISAIKGILNQSDQLAQTTARLNLMNDQLQSTDQLQKMIFQSAQNSRASFNDTAAAVSKMGLNARNAFKSNAELIAFMEQINKQFAIGGAGAIEQKNAMIQLTQAMAAGALRGEELNSILDQAPGIARAIEKNMGWAEGSIKSYAEEGEVTAQIVKESMFNMAYETNEAFNSMPKTFAQAWTDITNRAQVAFQSVLTKLNQLANSEEVIQFGNAIINTFVVVGIVLIDVFNTASMVYSFFANNWSIISPIIYGIVAALTAYLVVMGLVNMANIASAISTGMASLAADIYAASLAFQRNETFLATAAQYGLNAALLACPITWIIIAIIALIAIIYAAVAAVNKVTGTFYSATGFIFGCIATIGGIIYNTIANAWNLFASFVEFIVNVCFNTSYSINALFINLADVFLGSLESMTSGIDGFATSFANGIIDAVNVAIRAWNAFMSVLPDSVKSFLNIGVGTEIGHTSSITGSINSKRAELQGWLEANKPDNYWAVPKIDYINNSDSFQWGYDKGYALQNSIYSGFTDIFNNDQYDYSDMYNDMLDNLGNIADNTGIVADNAGKAADNAGKVKESLDITDEDLKYLRDFAGMEAVNKYTTAEIKVEMGGINNTVNSNMDLDGIGDYLAEIVEEQMNMTAKGAYDI